MSRYTEHEKLTGELADLLGGTQESKMAIVEAIEALIRHHINEHRDDYYHNHKPDY